MNVIMKIDEFISLRNRFRRAGLEYGRGIRNYPHKLRNLTRGELEGIAAQVRAEMEALQKELATLRDEIAKR